MVELIDENTYYQAFKQWLESGSLSFDYKDESAMNEKWIKFADEIGIELGIKPNKNQIYATIFDKDCWKEAKKYYSIISYRQKNELPIQTSL